MADSFSKVILVERDPHLQEALRIILESWGIQVKPFDSTPDAARFIDGIPPAMVIIDVPYADKADCTQCPLIKKLRQRRGFENVPIIIMTTTNRERIPPTIKKIATAIVEKPFVLDELKKVIKEPLQSNP